MTYLQQEFNIRNRGGIFVFSSTERTNPEIWQTNNFFFVQDRKTSAMITFTLSQCPGAACCLCVGAAGALRADTGGANGRVAAAGRGRRAMGVLHAGVDLRALRGLRDLRLGGGSTASSRRC